MGIFDRFFSRETRNAPKSARASDPYLAELFGFTGNPAVTPETVLSNSAVALRCIALRSELLASVGLHLFRRGRDGGRNRADDNPLYDVLHNNANETQSAFEFRELMIRCMDLHGNYFARIIRNRKGQVTELVPLLPGTVTVERLDTGRLRYKLSDGARGVQVLLQEEVLHVRGPSRDGVMGQSPIAMARGALGHAIQQRNTANALMTNAMRPGGVLSWPQPMTVDQKDQLRNSITNRFTGAEKAGNILILDGGAKFERMAFSPEDAEFLDSMKLSNEDTARIFGVPPTSVGILDKGTYSNVEQEAATLIQNCLGPLAARIEAAMSRCLLTPEGRRTLYIEHDLSGLLRGDVRSRFEAYRIGREIGALSANDVRRRENEPPIEKGDQYHMPANWIELGSTTPGVKA